MPSASAIVYYPYDESDDRRLVASVHHRQSGCPPRRPERLLLRPNHRALLLLCPLLPPSPTYGDNSVRTKRLPAEAWQRVLGFAIEAEEDGSHRLRLLLVCKSFQNLATPLFYSSVRVYTLRALDRFAAVLIASDAKWDSIRRIPHSTPGRWVQRLSLAQLAPCSPLAVDSILVKALPVMPFLTTLELDGRYPMSWRVAGVIPKALKVLTGVRVREELRFEGVKSGPEEDAVTGLVRTLDELEELSIQGPGLDLEEEEEDVLEEEPKDAPAVSAEVVLSRLTKLTLLDCPYTPVYRMLTWASLPVLTDLTLTTTPAIQLAPPQAEPVTMAPFIQPTPTSTFLSRHGTTLHKLSLVPTQQWPPAPAPAPDDILLGSPELRELTLSMPLPSRLFPAQQNKSRASSPVSPLLARLALSPDANASPTLAPAALPRAQSPAPTYALTTITVPVPTQAFLPCLTGNMLRNLCEVRFSSARWLRRGMGKMAQGAGVNGEMVHWRRELGRAGIKVLDSEGKEETEEARASTPPMLGLSRGPRMRDGGRGKVSVGRDADEIQMSGRRWSE